MSSACSLGYHDCIPSCKYWRYGECEIRISVQKQFISDLLAWRENEYNALKMHNFSWLKEGEANVIWYRETEHLRKLRGDKG